MVKMRNRRESLYIYIYIHSYTVNIELQDGAAMSCEANQIA